MTPPQPTRRLRPLSIIGLGAITLLFPAFALVATLAGGSTAITAPAARWSWIVVAAAWVLIVWLARLPRPVTTLVLAGAVGGVITVLAVGVIQLSFTGSAPVLTNAFAFIDLALLSTVGGLVCGLIAWGLQAATRRSRR